MNCYKNFAHIYDELIHGDVDYKKWANIILNICEEYNVKFDKYLDLACGTGNLTEFLGSHFKQVWGVDLSEDMLWEADKKLRCKNIKAKLVRQNICDLQLNRRFDLITCCLDSTNYILEYHSLKSYFYGIKEHLNENGIFIFDINSYYKLSTIIGNNIFTYDDEELMYVWQNQFDDEIVDMYLTFFVKEGDLYRRFDEEHSERAYREREIEALFKNSGFKLIEKLNNYTEDIVDNKTERIVYILRSLHHNE